jgi:hypothetical protein
LMYTEGDNSGQKSAELRLMYTEGDNSGQKSAELL